MKTPNTHTKRQKKSRQKYEKNQFKIHTKHIKNTHNNPKTPTKTYLKTKSKTQSKNSQVAHIRKHKKHTKS